MAHTTHGHHIPNTIVDKAPVQVARCGGPQLCPSCKMEAEMFWNGTREKPSEILRFFGYRHLPKDLAAVSKLFADVAWEIEKLPNSAEKSVALRKLLEAKDAAVRSVLPTDG